MYTYILDANVLSALRRPDREPRVADWVGKRLDQQLYCSVITIGEIERGIMLQERRNPEFAKELAKWLDGISTQFAERLLPFGEEESRVWGQLSARIGHSGADLQITATALIRSAIVVTRNVADFEPTGVEIENPF